MTQALRFPVAVVLAFLVTIALFWFLWGMVHVGFQVQEMAQVRKIEFSRLRKDTEVQQKRTEQAKREKPPIVPQMPSMSATSASVDAGGIGAFNPDMGKVAVGMSVGGGSDRDVMPLVRINPDYPQRAMSRGIEGWVILQFTITPQGTVTDVTVVEAQPAGIFDAAAIKAVGRWKYNPKVFEGVAVERRGIRVKLTFELED